MAFEMTGTEQNTKKKHTHTKKMTIDKNSSLPFVMAKTDEIAKRKQESKKNRSSNESVLYTICVRKRKEERKKQWQKRKKKEKRSK